MFKFLSKIVTHSSIQVIGINLEEDVISYTLILIQKKKFNISILKKETFLNFEELTLILDTKIPIILNIDGKGILNKKIDFDNEQDVNWYKNIKLETLHYTSSKIENVTFLSFTRKNLIDEWVAKFSILQFQVLDVYTGSFICSLLAKNIDKTSITTTQLIIHFEENNLVNFTRNENKEKKSYKIGDDILESNYLQLYASVIHFFIPIESIEKSNADVLNVEEYTFQKAFNYLGIFMLGFYLILLLISYFGINHFSTKNAELNYRNVYSNQVFKKLDDLEKQKNNKLKILSETGLTSNNFLTFYAYEINKNTLSGIQLSELKVNPLEAEMKMGKKVLLLNKAILISGQAQNEVVFNNWIENLKKMKWIKKFEISSIEINKKNWMQFQIKILIKDV